MDTKPLPIFFISQDLVDSRTAAFVSQKNNLLSDAIGKPDTQSVWYSRDHIASLLDEIDHAAGDGLRVFFAMYENDHPNYAGQLCLVMNPTRATDAGGHANVILENEPDFADRSSLARGLNLSAGGSVFNKAKGFNLGSPCPPLCD